ncbi:hypothetical protein ETD83_22375 [Actinomadura soli]|uniref:Uncharacterized protein n=1 Tax=Actinomadura soli TaxID=2508997 RepID=A0A5C4J8F5_9ACTN|nr:hypothetical protein [Actinomadura soli]TMQ95567.1 hypothetical protein ETD83_22375 [Actinomadura soli]
MHSDPAYLPLIGRQPCSMAFCGRSSCFHVRLETTSVPGDRAGGRTSCGAHLAEVVHELALRAREQRRYPAQVVVYAMTHGPRPNDTGPFDRLILGAIPV